VTAPMMQRLANRLKVPAEPLMCLGSETDGPGETDFAGVLKAPQVAIRATLKVEKPLAG
jgi:hypothetical protein